MQTSRVILKAAGEVKHYEDISYVENDWPVNSQDQKEIDAHIASFKRRSSNTGAQFFEDVLFKASFIKTFKNLLPLLEMEGGERVLEMGAGQGWASVLVKQAYPTCYVVASDLVPSEIVLSRQYEKQVNIFLDEKWSFNSRNMPFENDQFDRIFTMAAFHHFGDQGDFSKAIAEMLRVLKPGGQIKLLYEPSSPRYLYKLRMMRVNRRPDDVDEDVLVMDELKSLGRKLSCKVSYQYFPSALYRDSLTSTVYYFGLSKAKFLAHLLPCTVNVSIAK